MRFGPPAFWGIKIIGRLPCIRFQYFQTRRDNAGAGADTNAYVVAFPNPIAALNMKVGHMKFISTVS